LESCIANGTSHAMATYVWDFLFKPTLSYAFSEPHTYAYSGIGIVEMYISAYFPSIYWKTASLSVDAGVFGGEFNGIDYVSVSKAITSSKDIIELPDINKSDIGFTPDTVKNMILFGLGGIAGLGLNDINLIINNRPYSGFMDFMNKIGHEFSKKKIVTIIKSGLFHNFIPSTSKLATMYLMKYTERKAKLTTVQLPKIINYVPEEFEEAKIMYQLKSLLFGRNAMKELPKNNIKQLEELQDKYDFDIDYTNGNMIVDKKSFEKVFNDISKELKEWLKSKEAIELLARVDMQEFWNSEFNGGESKWYFDTLSYYPYKHYLEYNHLDEQVELTRFNDMNTEGHNNGKRTTYDKHVIAGTVIEKNIKGVVTLVSPDDEVITVRLGKDRYGKYNKKIMQGSGKNRNLLDDSWLNKGTNLMIIGYRRGNDFIANNYGTGFDSVAYKILVKDNKIEFVKR